jgi:hypothetical protein
MWILKEIYNKIITTYKNKNNIMQKLKSFEQYATEAKISNARTVEEDASTKRSNEAETYKNLLSEFKVTSVKELTEDQRSDFFNKLRDSEVNEALSLIEEGTRGQFGKIDKKGNITSVYTHYDSYPENILPLLQKDYKNGKNVDDVIKRGDSSGLDAMNKMNFYGDNSKPSTGSISNISKYLRDANDKGGAEFVYLWDEGNKEWLMADLYGKGHDDVYPAFESLSASVNEAIKVEYKRDAKKVATVYNNLFAKKLTDLGAMSKEGKLGCIKYLFEMAMEDANFSREGFKISKNIKGSIKSFEIKMSGLGNYFVKIGATTTKRVLDQYYSDLANAASWAGISIVEGTALYLESMKEEAAGQSLLNAFNMAFEGNENICEATAVMDAIDPKSKGLAKLLKKNKVTMEILDMNGPSGHPEVELTGSRKDITTVLADDEYGWDDEDLAEYIEESKVNEDIKCSNKKGHSYKEIDKDGTVECEHCGLRNSLSEAEITEAEVSSIEDFQEYATTVLKKAFGEEFDEAKAQKVIDGILDKSDGDYGTAVGILTNSLG